MSRVTIWDRIAAAKARHRRISERVKIVRGQLGAIGVRSPRQILDWTRARGGAHERYEDSKQLVDRDTWAVLSRLYFGASLDLLKEASTTWRN